MWNEFKKFAFKGNVIDMAVGIVIGTAFSAIVTALVNNIIMPLIGFITAGVNFEDLKLVLSPAAYDPGGALVKEEVALLYGAFLQQVVDFFIIAFCIFLVVKAINKMTADGKHVTDLLKGKKKKAEAPAEEQKPAPPTTEELLTQIRDLLANDKKEAGAADERKAE